MTISNLQDAIRTKDTIYIIKPSGPNAITTKDESPGNCMCGKVCTGGPGLDSEFQGAAGSGVPRLLQFPTGQSLAQFCVLGHYYM